MTIDSAPRPLLSGDLGGVWRHDGNENGGYWNTRPCNILNIQISAHTKPLNRTNLFAFSVNIRNM